MRETGIEDGGGGPKGEPIECGAMEAGCMLLLLRRSHSVDQHRIVTGEFFSVDGGSVKSVDMSSII